MKKLISKNLFYKLGSMIAAFALMITALNVNTTCMFIAYQDELPKSSRKLRKF